MVQSGDVRICCRTAVARDRFSTGRVGRASIGGVKMASKRVRESIRVSARYGFGPVILGEPWIQRSIL